MADKSPPKKWPGRYSIKGSLWSPDGKRLDFETDLHNEEAEAFVKIVAAMMKWKNSKTNKDSDVPIPPTLEEALAALDKKILSSEMEDFLTDIGELSPDKQELEFLGRTHFALGQWMRNNWGLWHGSPLRDSLIELGLKHADDMSGLILTCFVRRKFGRPLDIEGQVKHYQDYWAEIEKSADGQGQEARSEK